MSTFTVTTNCGTEREFSDRSDANEGKRTHQALCDECGDGDVRVDVRPDRPDQTTLGPETGDGRETSGREAAAERKTDGGRAVPASMPERMPESVQTDPLDVVPEYMVDYVDGNPAINKRGYAVIANRFDIAVEAEAITTAGETDHEYAEFVARAWKKEDGPEHAYTGHATARASEERRGMADNLNEMAETRAMKRAVAWASGVGILAWEEVASYVDEE